MLSPECRFIKNKLLCTHIEPNYPGRFVKIIFISMLVVAVTVMINVDANRFFSVAFKDASIFVLLISGSLLIRYDFQCQDYDVRLPKLFSDTAGEYIFRITELT